MPKVSITPMHQRRIRTSYVATHCYTHTRSHALTRGRQINYVGLLADVPLVGLAVLGWLGLRDAGQSMALDVCTRLAGSVPSLRYVGMVWYTHTYAPLEVGRVLDASIWYQVTAGSGPALKPKLARLSGSEGEGVYDALLASQGPPRRR